MCNGTRWNCLLLSVTFVLRPDSLRDTIWWYTFSIIKPDTMLLLHCPETWWNYFISAVFFIATLGADFFFYSFYLLLLSWVYIQIMSFDKYIHCVTTSLTETRNISSIPDSCPVSFSRCSHPPPAAPHSQVTTALISKFSFVCSWTSCKQKHTVCSLWCLSPLLNKFLISIHDVTCVNDLFIFIVELYSPA